MTKKDYVALARILKNVGSYAHNTVDAKLAIGEIKWAICSYCEKSNPTFDCEKFIEACEK